MQARCPYCTSVFETPQGGVQLCPVCKQKLNVPQPGEAGSSREPTPWERRAEQGFFSGLWQTWKRTMLGPEKFWAALRPDGPVGDAFLYYWLLAAAATVMAFLLQLAQLGSVVGRFKEAYSRMERVPPELERIFRVLEEHSGVLLLAGAIFAIVIFYPLFFLIQSVLIHLGALLFGAARNGFGATGRVVAYASAPALLGWFPLCGCLFWVYVLVLQCWGLMKAQQTTLARAIAAVVVPPLLLLCLCGVLFGLVRVAAGRLS